MRGTGRRAASARRAWREPWCSDACHVLSWKCTSWLSIPCTNKEDRSCGSRGRGGGLALLKEFIHLFEEVARAEGLGKTRGDARLRQFDRFQRQAVGRQ